MSKSSHTHISNQTCHKNTAGKSATHHLIDVNILFSHLGSIASLADNFWPFFGYFGVFTTSLFAHLGSIASLADKRATAARSFRKHDPVGMLRCSLHKLLDIMVMMRMMMMMMVRNVFMEYD